MLCPFVSTLTVQRIFWFAVSATPDFEIALYPTPTLMLPVPSPGPDKPSQRILAELLYVVVPVVYASSGTLVTMVSRIFELMLPMAYSPLALGVIEVAVSQAEPVQTCQLADLRVKPDGSTSVMTTLFKVAPIWLAVIVHVIVRFVGL